MDDDSCIKNLEHTFECLEEHPMTGVDEGLTKLSHLDDGAKGHADFAPPSGDQDDTLVDTQVDNDATDTRDLGDDGLPADLEPDAPGVFGDGILPGNAEGSDGLEKDELKVILVRKLSYLVIPMIVQLILVRNLATAAMMVLKTLLVMKW